MELGVTTSVERFWIPGLEPMYVSEMAEESDIKVMREEFQRGNVHEKLGSEGNVF